MTLFRPITDHAPALACSSLLRATLLTMDYIQDNGSIGLTPGKGLKRYFVDWAAHAFQWPHFTAEDLYGVNKVLNESDFPPLVVLHDLLIGARLARHYKGALHLTKLALTLKSRPAELWQMLVSHLLFELDHTDYARFDDGLVGNWDVFLNVINVEAQAGVSAARLCAVLFGGVEADFRRHQYRLAGTFYLHVLRPLCWAGLLDEHMLGRGLNQSKVFVKTPLWEAAFALETDANLQPSTRH